MLKTLKFAPFVVLSLSLLTGGAQGQTQPQIEKARETIAALNGVENYCFSIQKFSETRQARLFARVASSQGGPAKWMAFSSESQWRTAGQPEPAAWTWQKDQRVVLVRITVENGQDGFRYVDYCYDPNGKLARVTTAPSTVTHCDNRNFRCVVVSGTDWVFLPNGQKIPLETRFDWSVLRSEQTLFATSTLNPPEYSEASELPLANLLRRRF